MKRKQRHKMTKNTAFQTVGIKLKSHIYSFIYVFNCGRGRNMGWAIVRPTFHNKLRSTSKFI